MSLPMRSGDDLTEDERTELSVHSPNLMCLLEREPPKNVEETRAAAREEVAGLLHEIARLSERLRGNGKLSVEFSLPEIKALYEDIGDIPQRLIKPKLMQFYRRLDSFVGMNWLDPSSKRMGPPPKGM